MKRRDFLKAFSATTTVAAATSLVNIAEANPVIQTLEKAVILPDDKDFNVDWVFDEIGYCNHQYDGSSTFDFGVMIPCQYLKVFQQAVKKKKFLFSFKLQEQWFLMHSYTPACSDLPLPPYYQKFLEGNVFSTSDFNVHINSEVYDGFFSVELLLAELVWLDDYE